MVAQSVQTLQRLADDIGHQPGTLEKVLRLLDAITPAAIEIDYPEVLYSRAPHLRAYPVETVVAEKFKALVPLGVANSRLKDFYDLCVISRTFELRQATLVEAVLRTFEVAPENRTGV